MKEGLKLSFHGLSDIGVVRDENQDSLMIHEPQDEDTRKRKGVLVAIADGMGGLDEGSTASRLATEAVLRSYYAAEGEPRSALESAVREANRAIHDHAQAGEGSHIMGSTLTALVLVGDEGCIAQVGDSRAYRMSAGKLEQLTRDHSLVRELADRGELDEQTARSAFHRNVLTRGLGLREEVDVDMYDVRDLQDGDTLLLSSDGLHAEVELDELAACLARHGERLEAACKELIETARERGGPDNITVAIARVSAAPRAANAPVAARSWSDSDRTGWLLPLAIFLSFAAGVLLTLWVERPGIDDAGLRAIRTEVDAALDEARRPDEAGIERLKERLERVRQALRDADR